MINSSNDMKERNSITYNEITVVIRSVGERTSNYTYETIKKDLPAAHIYIINISPFEDAIRKCFELASGNNSKYLVTIDGDILLKPNAINDLIIFADKQSSKTIVTTGLVFDKFLNCYKKAGNHIYNTKYLDQLIKNIPRAGTKYRPESTCIKNVAEKNKLKRVTAPFAIGLHDFEQYYRDVYRIFFLHAHKRSREVLLKVNEWKEKGIILENDYMLASEAIFDGVRSKERAITDNNFYSTKSNDALKRLQLTEKEKLSYQEALNITQSTFDSISKNKSPLLSKKDILLNIFRKYGLIAGPLKVLAKLLNYISNRLADLFHRSDRISSNDKK